MPDPEEDDDEPDDDDDVEVDDVDVVDDDPDDVEEDVSDFLAAPSLDGADAPLDPEDRESVR